MTVDVQLTAGNDCNNVCSVTTPTALYNWLKQSNMNSADFQTIIRV